MSVNTPLRELILINVGRVNGIMQTIAEDVGNLAAENTRLRAENAELRAGQGRWPEGDDSPAGEQVPRVIDADELKVGMWAAIKSRDEEDEGLWFATRIHPSDRGPEESIFEGDTIVLLEDEPVKDVDRFAPSLKENGENFTGPLTVHALNTAPVGSTVSTPGKTRTKRDDGTWFTVSPFEQHTRTSEELLALGYANATLTHPKRGNHE